MNNKNQLPTIRVYDNGGTTADRYTVVIDDSEWDSCSEPGTYTILSLDKGGKYFSQFGQGIEGKHLGNRVGYCSLDAATRKHIMSRLLG